MTGQEDCLSDREERWKDVRDSNETCERGVSLACQMMCTRVSMVGVTFLGVLSN